MPTQDSPPIEDQLDAILIEHPLMSVVESLYQIALREEERARLRHQEDGARKWGMASRILNQTVNQLVGQHCGDVP